MKSMHRPRRSALYMPAANQRAMDKARSLATDVVIFDLEDAVAPGNKALARRQACDQVRAGGYGRREMLIRINGANAAEFEEDLAAAVSARPHGIVIPKVEGAAMLRRVSQRMAALGGDLPLWPMIETPAGVSDVDAIAAAPGVEGLILGTADLTAALRARETPARTSLLYAMSRLVLAARRYDLAALDGVSPVLDDVPAFLALCQQGRELGFDGKTLIHPAQVAPANAAFGPTEADIHDAERVIAAWRASAHAGQGVAVLDGRMIESLHVEEAERIVAFHAALQDPA